MGGSGPGAFLSSSAGVVARRSPGSCCRSPAVRATGVPRPSPGRTHRGPRVMRDKSEMAMGQAVTKREAFSVQMTKPAKGKGKVSGQRSA